MCIRDRCSSAESHLTKSALSSLRSGNCQNRERRSSGIGKASPKRADRAAQGARMPAQCARPPCALNTMQSWRGRFCKNGTGDGCVRRFDVDASAMCILPISGRCVHEHAPMLGEAATDLHRNLLPRGACKPIIGPRPPVIISPPPTPRSMVLTGWNTTDNFF